MQGEIALNDSDDRKLVSEAREGNRSAFGVLVRRYQEQAVMVAQHILRNLELAKDTSQNAFVKAYFGLKNFREDAQFKTWFFRIVINEAKDVLRREKARGLFKNLTTRDSEDGVSESILEVIPASGASPRETFEAKEMRGRLETAIYALPERQREVFILRYFNELSLSEISEVLDIAIGTVKAHLAHGTEKLKSSMLVSGSAQTQMMTVKGGD